MQSLVEAETGGGAVRGVRHRGVAGFLGIPYGESPAGAQRFQRARPAPPWSGVRDATVFGPAAPQLDARLGVPGRYAEVMSYQFPHTGSEVEGGPISEDCLVLNVWSPEVDVQAKLPVMVWLHGGAFVQGTSSAMFYEGDELAALGNVVVVTLNHRLGILGFLPLQNVLGSDWSDSGAVGMLDIVMALEWVRDNISSFGGDPGNVTVFGQSGGGMKINTLLAMPSARGLFHKAINQSGPPVGLGSLEDGEKLVSKVLDLAGLTAASAHRLVDLPLEQLLEIQGGAMSGAPGSLDQNVLLDAVMERSRTGLMAFLPWQREVGDVPALFEPDALADVPLMTGCTTHDPSLLICGLAEYEHITRAEVRSWATRRFGEDGASACDLYVATFPEEPPRLTLARLFNDPTFRLGAVEMAGRMSGRSSDVFMYEFGYETEILDNLLGATHSLDLPFVFNNAWRSPFAGYRPARLQVAENTARAWAAFARSGSPNHDGIPMWRPYDSSERSAMFIDVECRLTAAPTAEHLARFKQAVVAD